MTTSERLIKTLNFCNMTGEGGACTETFYPWDLTANRWVEENLPTSFCAQKLYPQPTERYQRYFDTKMTEQVCAYEQYMGLDALKRVYFHIPFKCFDTTVLEDTPEYTVRLDEDGWQRKYYKNRDLVQNIKAAVEDENDWNKLKQKTLCELETYCTEEKLRYVYGAYAQSQKRKDFSIRISVTGFFWISRELMGVEEQLVAFYEKPELLHAINGFVLEIYLRYLDKIFDVFQPEMMTFAEDLSGSNGPMISPAMFEEFVGAYYKKLFPFLKQKGVKNIFVDTDGDFAVLIPRFIEAGVDGFLPMDVNAGMDIVAVRKAYPKLKFIGAYNKLCIAKGKESIDAEFARILPVIRQGGYVPGADHQVAPETSFENYRYYLLKLREAMLQCGADTPRCGVKNNEKIKE